jgi:hypothetical protein
VHEGRLIEQGLVVVDEIAESFDVRLARKAPTPCRLSMTSTPFCAG